MVSNRPMIKYISHNIIQLLNVIFIKAWGRAGMMTLSEKQGTKL